MCRDPEFGTGEIEHTGRPIVHFGTPPGTTYEPGAHQWENQDATKQSPPECEPPTGAPNPTAPSAANPSTTPHTATIHKH